MQSNRKHTLIERYMSTVGSIGNLMFYFQAYEIFNSQHAGAVSLPGFSISVLGLTSWMLYGFYIKNTPLIVANIIGVTGALAVVVGICYYGQPSLL